MRKPPSSVAMTWRLNAGEAVRVAVERERHHLVLVSTGGNRVSGDLLVQEAERVWERLRGEHLELAAATAPTEVGRGLAAAVEDEHRAVEEGGGEVGRRRVGDVVGHELHPPGCEPWQPAGEEPGALDAHSVRRCSHWGSRPAGSASSTRRGS